MIPLEWSEDGHIPLFAAYVKAQAGMGDVVKDASNPHFSTKYATLSSVISAVIPPMTEAGLAVLQSPSFDGESLTVETLVVHSEGGWMRSVLNVKPGKPDAQGLGSAITYLRRYALMSLAGVAPEDDDGNAASVSGEGGKKFDAPRKTASDDSVLQAFIASMKMNKTREKVDAWASREANAIGEQLNKRDQERMQDAFEAYRIECDKAAAAQADTSKTTTATKSLADRAAIFESAMKDCKDQAALRRTYETGQRLRDDLDKSDPERLVEINQIYEGLFAKFEMSLADAVMG